MAKKTTARKMPAAPPAEPARPGSWDAMMTDLAGRMAKQLVRDGVFPQARVGEIFHSGYDGVTINVPGGKNLFLISTNPNINWESGHETTGRITLGIQQMDWFRESFDRREDLVFPSTITPESIQGARLKMGVPDEEIRLMSKTVGQIKAAAQACGGKIAGIRDPDSYRGEMAESFTTIPLRYPLRCERQEIPGSFRSQHW